MSEYLLKERDRAVTAIIALRLNKKGAPQAPFLFRGEGLKISFPVHHLQLLGDLRSFL
jgi:hypothetical protein